jgi:hypothetical protein
LQDQLAASLARAWTHSHEEDEEQLIVYRSHEYPFPAGRRPRATVELLADGHLNSRGGPAPADRRAEQTGRWQVEGDVLVMQLEGGPETRYHVESVDQERLVLRPLS